MSAGDKIPRKGGPGITRSDLLIINKTDLAPLVGASLDVMREDATRMRGERPFVFSNLKAGSGLTEIIAFIIEQGMLPDRLPDGILTRSLASEAHEFPKSERSVQ